ncbi:MAG: type II toxin-antitoxin system VapC family toxin [Desulfovibrionaceae bacterium]|jgi:predicted nucleic acid-binding protein|nr:type II toxin-antitoxin system VapC family toxin [Desulfovibrionaceae bacterium]
MIVLDTNVVSEAMRPDPDPVVMAWLNRQAAQTLFLTSVTLAELLFGITALPAGKRKDRLTGTLEGLMGLFRDNILMFDVQAARHYAELVTTAKSAGRGLPVPDGYIAAIAASRGFIVATRDKSPFLAARLRVIDPWTDEGHAGVGLLPLV